MGREINIWLHNNPYNKKTEAKLHSDAILQQLLQNTLNSSTAVDIYKNTHGKPYLKEPVCFSHSNSKNLHAYVVSSHHEIGIDVEFINRKRNVLKLAQRYFHASEAEYLNRMPKSKIHDHFYVLWSKKEAWCKLEGGTLWSYLKRSVLPDQDIIDAQTGQTIYMLADEKVEGFSCAVATTDKIGKLRINVVG